MSNFRYYIRKFMHIQKLYFYAVEVFEILKFKIIRAKKKYIYIYVHKNI